MPRKINFTLPTESVQELEQAIQSDDRPEVRKRATAIRQLHLGKKPAEVAEIMLVTPATIYGWWHRHQLHGVEGLAYEVKRAPVRKVTAAYRAEIEVALSKDPEEFGYTFPIWTLETLRDHLHRKTGINITPEWLSQLIKREGYVFRRPKHTLSNKQDKLAKAEAAEALEALKKKAPTEKSAFSLWTKQP